MARSLLSALVVGGVLWGSDRAGAYDVEADFQGNHLYFLVDQLNPSMPLENVVVTLTHPSR